MSRRARIAFKVAGLVLGVGALAYLYRALSDELDPAAILPVLPATLLVVPWFVLPLTAATEAWRVLVPRAERPAFTVAAWLSWLGLSVNWLLPVATIGGEIVKLALIRRRGASGAVLAASLIVDKTLQVVTQIIFVLGGAALFAACTGELAWPWAGLSGLVAVTAGLALFVAGQRAGMFGRLATVLKYGGPASLTESALRLDEALAASWRRRRDLLRGCIWRLAFRMLLAGEVAIVLAWAGHPATVLEVLVLESITQGARMSAFVVPAGIGMQEGALIAAGLALGVPPEALVALALVKRLREVIVAVPALVLWQVGEARHARRLASGGAGI